MGGRGVVGLFAFIAVCGLPFWLGASTESKNGFVAFLILAIAVLVVAWPVLLLARWWIRAGQIRDLKRSGFKAAHELPTGTVRLLFDDERREFALVDHWGTQRFPYDQLKQLKYVYDGGKIAFTLTTLDPRRPIYTWRALGSPLNAEAWLAQVDAIVSA